jgi:Flp pilus assembly pilin Flp
MVGMPSWIQTLLTVARALALGTRRHTAAVSWCSRVAAQGLVEYGILLAVIAVTVLGAIQAFGGGIAAFFSRLLGHFASLA